MKLKAKKDLTHHGKPHKPGDVFEAPDHEGQELIKQGHAEEHKEEEPGKEKGTGGSGSGGTGGQQQQQR